jgi:hypothetical protein
LAIPAAGGPAAAGAEPARAGTHAGPAATGGKTAETSLAEELLLAFAECRSFIGDGCEPAAKGNYSTNVKDRVLCMRTSTDLGVSWGPLVANLSRGLAMYPTAVYDPGSKRVLLQFSSWPTLSNGKSRNYYSPVPHQIISTDYGRSWSGPRPVLPEIPTPNLFLGSCRGLHVASTGRLLFVGYNHSLKPAPMISHAFVWHSDDHGDSWELADVYGGLAGVAEPQLAVLPAAHDAITAGLGATAGTGASTRPPVAAALAASTATVGVFGHSNGQLGCKCQDLSISTDGGSSFGTAANLTSLPVSQTALTHLNLRSQHNLILRRVADSVGCAVVVSLMHFYIVGCDQIAVPLFWRGRYLYTQPTAACTQYLLISHVHRKRESRQSAVCGTTTTS